MADLGEALRKVLEPQQIETAARSGEKLTSLGEALRSMVMPAPVRTYIDTWESPRGKESYAPEMRRPCSCGCDDRSVTGHVGYLIGSAKGRGITIFAPDEETYQAMRQVFGGEQ